jgi:hypothetical protein
LKLLEFNGVEDRNLKGVEWYSVSDVLGKAVSSFK